jgi:ribosome biogenesis GTPase
LRRVTTTRALVIASGKNVLWVSLDGEQAPRIAQLRRSSGKRSMPVPGDVAHVRILEDERVVVERLEPRTSVLQRRSLGGREKTMAANVDTLVTVTALADPAPRLVTLDQLLAFAELEEIAPIVVFTKPDLGAPGLREELVATYERVGYRTVVCSPKFGGNVDALRDALAGRRALLAGNSGVGKSSIFRALGGEAVVGEVSRFGVGRQTTTMARLCRFDDGFLIDSPGVNEFGLGSIDAATLSEAFPEIRALRGRCRFTDCTHLAEPGCAVRAEVESGAMAGSRYADYRAILEAQR